MFGKKEITYSLRFDDFILYINFVVYEIIKYDCPTTSYVYVKFKINCINKK